jgi:hypothetical protein
VSLRNIPLCPITRAAFGACARASSNAVFHSNKSSEVSACITIYRGEFLKRDREHKKTFYQRDLIIELKRNAKYLKSECTTITAIWEKDGQQLLVFSDYHTASEKCS